MREEYAGKSYSGHFFKGSLLEETGLQAALR